MGQLGWSKVTSTWNLMISSERGVWLGLVRLPTPRCFRVYVGFCGCRGIFHVFITNICPYLHTTTSRPPWPRRWGKSLFFLAKSSFWHEVQLSAYTEGAGSKGSCPSLTSTCKRNWPRCWSIIVIVERVSKIWSLKSSVILDKLINQYEP